MLKIGDKKADKKKKTQKSSPELRDLVRVFLGFSPEVRVNFRRFFSFYRLLGHPTKSDVMQCFRGTDAQKSPQLRRFQCIDAPKSHVLQIFQGTDAQKYQCFASVAVH